MIRSMGLSLAVHMIPTDDGQRKVCFESSTDGKYCFTAEDPSRDGGRGRRCGRVEITCHVCTKDTGNEDKEVRLCG